MLQRVFSIYKSRAACRNVLSLPESAQSLRSWSSTTGKRCCVTTKLMIKSMHDQPSMATTVRAVAERTKLNSHAM